MLNLDKDDDLLDAIKDGARLVVLGYGEKEVVIADEGGDEGEGDGDDH